MREILFRGKRTDNEEWVDGLLTIMWGQYHIIKPSDENTAYPIDPETVCQYTGYTDFQKRKVFEHDIVFCEGFGVHGRVVFKEGKLLIEWDKIDYYLKSDFHYWLTQGGSHIRGGLYTIGNIFDNPELMGEQP